MSFAGLTGADAVDAFGRTCACEGGVVRGAFAFDVVVARAVGVAAQGTYDGAFADRALRDRVVKRMASVASSKNRERYVFFDPGDSSKEGRRVTDELLYPRAIGVYEGDRYGGVAFVGWDGGGEPPRGVDERKAFADRVSLKLVDECDGGGRVAIVVPFDRNAVDDDFGEAVLRDKAGTGSEGSGENGPIAVDHVVRRFTCEGEDEVMVEA